MSNKNIKSYFSKTLTLFRSLFASKSAWEPSYRVLSIERNKDDDYDVVVQIIDKSHTFKMKPEEILADDQMTSAFSPLDVRALTYLGYLGINSPKYKILANRLSEQDQQFIYAIKEKGKKQTIVKTSNEIAVDRDFIANVSQDDAHRIGFTAGAHSVKKEEELKKMLSSKKSLKSKKK